MGFDVTYHPITPEEIHEWYFDPLEDDDAMMILARKYGIIEESYYRHIKRVRNVLAMTPLHLFDSSHGLLIASTQGLFRRYDYFRNSLLTFVIASNPEYQRYTQSLKKIVPKRFRRLHFMDQIESHYSSGVYVPPELTPQLLHDIETASSVRKNFLDVFHDEKTLERFLNLLRYSETNGFGILEATDVSVPLINIEMDWPGNREDGSENETASAAPLSIAPFLREPYDSTKEKYEGKYYIDDFCLFHENLNNDCVFEPFYEPTLDAVKQMIPEQTPKSTEKIMASFKTKPGESLPVRLKGYWPLSCTYSCSAFLLFSATVITVLSVPITELAWLAIIVFLSIFVFASILENFLPTVFKSLEIEEHPVRLGKETRLAITLQGPKWFKVSRKVRSLSVELNCVCFFKSNEINTLIHESLYSQRIFAMESPLDFDTEKRIFDRITFQCGTVPTLDTPDGRVEWMFRVSVTDKKNHERVFTFPFIVVPETEIK